MGNKLSGQVAWIGGGASGIGAAIAELFSAQGARVVVVDIQEDAGKQLVQRITDGGGIAFFVSVDVANEQQVASGIASAAHQFGALHILVNCAGIVHAQSLHEYSAADWDRLMAVNVKSIFLAVKHGFQYLRKQRRSYVVNIGSISSFVGQAGTPAYTASKGAVLQLTRSIALDYAAYGMRCNCICPGITDTPMLRSHLNTTSDPDGTLRQRLRRVPTGEALQPLDIARAALYLSCEDSSGITGTSLVVDGGYLAAAEWDTDAQMALKDTR